MAKRPKPIQVRVNRGVLLIEISGYRDKTSQPYLRVDTLSGLYGYIEDRDVKRLRAWCDDCLKKRKSS